jgi:cold shock CspA family protein
MATQVTETSPARLLGQVKWFNNKTGYGFITAIDGEVKDKDIFVHQSTIRVTQEQYKYLVEGEYVEFQLSTSTTGNHEFQAVDVTGIKEGVLMCEKRNARRPTTYETTDERRTYDRGQGRGAGRGRGRGQGRGQGPTNE